MLLIGFFALLIPFSLIFWFINLFFYFFTSKEDPWQALSPIRWLLAFIVPLVMAHWGLRRNSVDQTGAVMGLLVGFVLTLSNYCFVASLFAFFVTASKATKFRANRKKQLELDHKEGGGRNWVQVLCNGGVATEIAILYMIDGGCGEHVINYSTHYNKSWLSMAILGALACSSGDTFSSEIGTVIGNWQPRLVTTFRKVPKGTNGAVSLVGTLASIIGGLLVGLAFYAMLLFRLGADTLEKSPPQWPIIVLAMIAGLLGSLVDSYLGATIQYSGFHSERKVVVEKPGPDVRHISGVDILDNHSVNLLCTIILAISTPYIGFHLWGYVS